MNQINQESNIVPFTPEELPIPRPMQGATNSLLMVQKLRDTSILEGNLSCENYMKNVSKRCHQYDGAVISSATTKDFINDLIDADYMEPPYCVE